MCVMFMPSCVNAGEKRVHNQGMLNALGAWLHCRQADLHADAERSHYSSPEAPHELSEQEIRTVTERISGCEELFAPGQKYVSWAVSQIVPLSVVEPRMITPHRKRTHAVPRSRTVRVRQPFRYVRGSLSWVWLLALTPVDVCWQDWNRFVSTFKVVPFTAKRLADIVLADSWTEANPSSKKVVEKAASDQVGGGGSSSSPRLALDPIQSPRGVGGGVGTHATPGGGSALRTPGGSMRRLRTYVTPTPSSEQQSQTAPPLSEVMMLDPLARACLHAWLVAQVRG